jgi:hypothetical protein
MLAVRVVLTKFALRSLSSDRFAASSSVLRMSGSGRPAPIGSLISADETGHPRFNSI